MKLRTGLVSISFRPLSPQQIVELCQQTRLESIEWGSDVHVLPGDLKTARQVGQLTREAGLEVACYGSYYRCDGSDFTPVVETALELGAPLIRVWAGKMGSSEFSTDEWFNTLASLYEAAELAEEAGIIVATEYHGGTLTDKRDSTTEMLESVGHPNLRTFWQPLRRGPGYEARVEENLEDLRAVAPYLSNIHAYEWREGAAGREAFSLQESQQWPLYMQELRSIGGDHTVLLEFVPGDAPEALPAEAAALQALIQAVSIPSEPATF
jgi:sugar phosphate isomerase/epimerase